MTQPYPPQPPYGQPDPRQWQGYGPPAPAPKKRRKWPWVVGGVVLLLILISSIGGKDSSTAPTTAGGGSAAAKPAQTDGQPVAAGETVTSDDLQITAEPVRKVKPKYTDPQLCSKVTYRNTGQDEEFFNVIDWKIQSPDGVQQMATYALDKGLSSGQLAPGGSVTGDVCRQGAADKGEYVIILDRTFLDPIRWKTSL
jgi:hypothetical protein